MTDVFNKAKRSEVMSRIRANRNKSTELALASIFRSLRITGWRRNQSLKGRPDFTFRRKRIAVFVDGCFWHGCPRHFKMPKNNRAFWEEKIGANRRRDRAITKALSTEGWRVFRIWEHDLKNPSTSSRLRNMIAVLQSASDF